MRGQPRMQYITRNPSQTKKLARTFGQKILKTKRMKKAIVIALVGDLGGGKTTFLQGFAKGIKVKEKILSPTFVILKKFKIPKVKSQKSKVKGQWFYHIDCYRIKKPKELMDLGFKEIISNPKNIVAIEWAEKIKKILPKNTIWIKFEFKNKKTRKISYRS